MVHNASSSKGRFSELIQRILKKYGSSCTGDFLNTSRPKSVVLKAKYDEEMFQYQMLFLK